MSNWVFFGGGLNWEKNILFGMGMGPNFSPKIGGSRALPGMRRLNFYIVFAGLDDYIDYLLSSGTDTEPVKVGILWAPLGVNLFAGVCIQVRHKPVSTATEYR